MIIKYKFPTLEMVNLHWLYPTRISGLDWNFILMLAVITAGQGIANTIHFSWWCRLESPPSWCVNQPHIHLSFGLLAMRPLPHVLWDVDSVRCEFDDAWLGYVGKQRARIQTLEGSCRTTWVQLVPQLNFRARIIACSHWTVILNGNFEILSLTRFLSRILYSAMTHYCESTAAGWHHEHEPIPPVRRHVSCL
jgi:hypothetical protein